jgi:cytochrome P450
MIRLETKRPRPSVVVMLGRRDAGWVARTAADARVLLADDRLGVPAAEPDDVVGTVRWLRSQISRFVNGPQHRDRRAEVERELARVSPAELAASARNRASVLLTAGRTGALVVRQAPTAALAELLGVADPNAAAEAVLDVAPAYFPGADADVEARADAAVARLLALLDGVPLQVALARITLLIQGCEATGALVEAALAHGGQLEAVLRERPPLPAIRRVALVDAALAGAFVRAGDPVVVDVAAASDPDVFTFGAGRRPCPARPHAVAAAEAVVEVLRVSR